MATTKTRSTKPKVPHSNGKRPDVLEVEFDIDNLELEDLPTIGLLADLSQGGYFNSANLERIIDLLDRAVVGGVVGKGYKLTDFKVLGSAFIDAYKAANNPETAEGN